MLKIRAREGRTGKGTFLLLIVLVFVLGGLSSSFAVSNEQDSKRILFISSYSPSFQTFFHQIEGVRSELDNGDNILDIEFMDTKRFLTEENLTQFYKSIKYKLNELPPYDVIIVSDDNGLNFVMEYKEDLFSEIPIIFWVLTTLIMLRNIVTIHWLLV